MCVCVCVCVCVRVCVCVCVCIQDFIIRSITICHLIRLRRHLHVHTSHKDNAYTINHVHEFPGVWLSKLLPWHIQSHLCGTRDTHNRYTQRTHRYTDAQMNTIIK